MLECRCGQRASAQSIPPRRIIVKADIIQDNWTQLRGPMQDNWHKLTAADLAPATGNHRYLVDRLQERYGWQKDKAEQECAIFEQTMKSTVKRQHAA